MQLNNLGRAMALTKTTAAFRGLAAASCSAFNRCFSWPASAGTVPLRRFSDSPHAQSQTHDVLCFKGDGIGPEIIDASRKVIEETGTNVRWHDMEMGYEAKQRTGVYISEDHVEAFDKFRVLFKGPLTIPPKDSNTYIDILGKRFTSGNQVFRKHFQLYANVRPAQSFQGVKSRYDNVDLVVVRENTEDVYTGEEEWVDKDTVHCIKRITRQGSQRIAKFAFDYAVKNERSRVTALHKANVCKQSDGLFLSTFYDTFEQFFQKTAFEADDCLADSCLTKIVLDPSAFDVLCCPNLYGDLVSDLAGGLIGSLGLCPSANMSETHALFEPSHGSAPDIAGQGVANPVSQLLSGAMLLDHLGEQKSASRVRAAVSKTFADGVIPRDLGGQANTEKFTTELLARMKDL